MSHSKSNPKHYTLHSAPQESGNTRELCTLDPRTRVSVRGADGQFLGGLEAKAYAIQMQEEAIAAMTTEYAEILGASWTDATERGRHLRECRRILQEQRRRLNVLKRLPVSQFVYLQ